mgnify:CR=1 FL=1
MFNFTICDFKYITNYYILSTLFKKALLEKIENDFDLRVGQEALKEYKQDPVTYSVAEMRAKYGL